MSEPLMVQPCGWVHDIRGRCLEYVAEQTDGHHWTDKCTFCGKWRVMGPPTHDVHGEPVKETAA